MTFRLLQAQPAKLIPTLAVDVHAAAIFLHNRFAIGTRFSVQEHPLVSVFIGTAAARLPNLNHIAVDWLVA